MGKESLCIFWSLDFQRLKEILSSLSGLYSATASNHPYPHAEPHNRSICTFYFRLQEPNSKFQ